MQRVPGASPDPHVQPVVLSTKEPTINIEGVTSDSDKLLDTYIFAGSRKIFYRSNRNGQDAKRMPFDAAVPLRPGVKTPKTKQEGEAGGADD